MQLKKYKTLYIFLAWVLGGILFSTMLLKSRYALNTSVCSGIKVKIDFSKGTHFVDENGIRKIITEQLPNRNVNSAVKDINLQKIESYLEMNPHIENAELYFDFNGKLWAEITQRTPLLRVVNAQNISYYISEEGQKMPVSDDFSARVPVATGYINDNNKTNGNIDAPIVHQIYNLCRYLKTNEFLNALIEQIYVNTDSDLVLIPKIGKQRIVLGNADDLESKFKKLTIFYEQAMPYVGWNTYQTINLKYANQILCTRR